jgi:hypothetical protein
LTITADSIDILNEKQRQPNERKIDPSLFRIYRENEEHFSNS